MKIYIIALVISLCSCDLNNKISNNSAPEVIDPDQPVSTSSTDNMLLYASCMEEICGAEDRSFHSLLKSTYSEIKNTRLPNKVAVEMRELAAFEANKFVRESNQISQLKDIDFEALSNEQRALSFLNISITLYGEGFYDEIRTKYFDGIPKLWSLYRAFQYNRSLLEYSSIILQSPIEAYRRIYSGKSIDQAVVLERQRFRKQWQKLANTRLISPVGKAMIEALIPRHSVHKVMETNQYSELHLQDFSGALRITELLYETIVGKKEPTGNERLLHQDISPDDLRTLLLRVIAAKLPADFDPERAETTIDDLQEQAEFYFSIAYKANIKALPSTTEIKRFKDYVAGLQSTLLNDENFLTELSTRNSYIKKAFANMRIIHSMTSSEFAEYVEATLAETNKANRKNKLLFQQNLDFRAILDTLNFIDKSSYTPSKVFNFVRELEEQFSLGLSDAILPQLNVVFVSWATLRQFEAGQAIFMHELGHRLFALIKADYYANTMNPQDKQHMNSIWYKLESMHAHAPPKQDYYYLNEDFSDYISATSESNVGCFLINRKTDLSTVNSVAEDCHSASFLRALHIHKLNFHSLPDSCRSYVANQGEVIAL